MKKRTHSAKEIARTLSLFFAVRRIMRTKFASGKKIDPSTWLRIETMKFIADHGEPNMKDVAGYLSITAPSATSLIRGLVESGFVTCSADVRDKRTSRLVLTPKGKAELKTTGARSVRIVGELFSILSEAELAAFSSTLERIKKNHGS